MNTKRHIAFKISDQGHCTSSSNFIICHRHSAVHCCLRNTMFTFSIVVMYMYMGVPYFVQVIGGGLCPLHKLLGALAPYAPLPKSVYVTYMYLRLFVVVSKCRMFTCSYMQCVCNKCVHIGAQKYTTMFVSSRPCSIHLRQFIHLLLFTICNVQQYNGYLGTTVLLGSYIQLFYWALICH